MDLIKELADKLGFNFTFKNGGNDYGSYNKETNESTGMLHEIIHGVSKAIDMDKDKDKLIRDFTPFQYADLAITDLTITADREEAIDFSIPFMNLGKFNNS